ncbi:hypothetical protein NNX28_16340 [Arthrobacter sp. zg-Y859]|uniref:Uncharacterized protein n=1 Tax=Arthrobacter jinronghuae TaxID=2964609 RepID=A0ABT1NWK6_9MICC|nr:hypothetical protein [Arthrobacter jinronghuae]MCQ1951492.1 hypothetical protein [Arthrobacter jinronghuae]UWX78869.1 hypothetical protein N2K98_01220 [Arthrobacter jinronghuae]
MPSSSLPSDPALFLWASHLARAAGDVDSSRLSRGIATVWPLIEQYIDSYRRGKALPIMTMLSILEICRSGPETPPFCDGRAKLLKVWECLGNLNGVRGTPLSVLTGRVELILALNDLLIIDETPPNVEIYITVLDAELAAMHWALLDLLPVDCALQVQQIDEDWRASAMEEPIDEMPEGW